MTLKDFMRENKINQCQAAERLGVSTAVVNKLVNGKRKPSNKFREIFKEKTGQEYEEVRTKEERLVELNDKIDEENEKLKLENKQLKNRIFQQNNHIAMLSTMLTETFEHNKQNMPKVTAYYIGKYVEVTRAFANLVEEHRYPLYAFIKETIKELLGNTIPENILNDLTDKVLTKREHLINTPLIKSIVLDKE